MIDPEVRQRLEAQLSGRGLQISDIDERPWGGELLFDPDQIEILAQAYFAGQQLAGRPTTAKVLMVAPHQRCSWQYHHRRSECWRVISGPVGVEVGRTDDEPAPTELAKGQVQAIGPQMRHRLIGLETWGAVAELWFDDDPDHPSAESDIVHLADDYHRS